MLLLVLAFGLFCAFIAYAPDEVVKGLLAGAWVLMLLGAAGTVGCAIIEQAWR